MRPHETEKVASGKGHHHLENSSYRKGKDFHQLDIQQRANIENIERTQKNWTSNKK